MKLYLQFGHGMMAHCSALLTHMRGTTVILSPRDMDQGQIEKFSAAFVSNGGKTLLDPQLYATHSSHWKLTAHTYWPTNHTTQQSDIQRVLAPLWELNVAAKTSAFILPGLQCKQFSSLWIRKHNEIVAAAQDYGGKKIGTVCLSAELVSNKETLDQVLLEVAGWSVDGYYVVVGHPQGDYFVDAPDWIANLLSFCAGLKLKGREVILGYSNQQFLCFACAGVDAIASGTWMNVRSFTLEKFLEPDGQVKRKNTWYYCPQALSEVKPEYLDIAFRQSILSNLAPLPIYSSGYADVLFSGAQPTTTGFNEPLSFRHYLSCLGKQCEAASKSSFSETLQHQRDSLETARRLIDSFHRKGVFGQNRDFGEYVDVSLSALAAFDSEYGFSMGQRWASL